MKYSEIVVSQIKGFEKKCQDIFKEFKFQYRIDDKEDILYVDGDLYDIFNYGHADYNFGSELDYKVNDLLQSHGVIMENQGGGVFKFYKI